MNYITFDVVAVNDVIDKVQTFYFSNGVDKKVITLSDNNYNGMKQDIIDYLSSEANLNAVEGGVEFKCYSKYDVMVLTNLMSKIPSLHIKELKAFYSSIFSGSSEVICGLDLFADASGAKFDDRDNKADVLRTLYENCESLFMDVYTKFYKSAVKAMHEYVDSHKHIKYASSNFKKMIIAPENKVDLNSELMTVQMKVMLSRPLYVIDNIKRGTTLNQNTIILYNGYAHIKRNFSRLKEECISLFKDYPTVGLNMYYYLQNIRFIHQVSKEFVKDMYKDTMALIPTKDQSKYKESMQALIKNNLKKAYLTKYDSLFDKVFNFDTIGSVEE